MKNLKLVTFSVDSVTIGKLYDGKELICHTVERPWLKNGRNVSCIPAGKYIVKMTNSPKFGLTYKVTNVPGRTHILFHKGNSIDDSFGCILPVSTIDVFNRKIGGLSSGRAYTKMNNHLGGESFNLEIIRH
jgi:hypothetical protein